MWEHDHSSLGKDGWKYFHGWLYRQYQEGEQHDTQAVVRLRRRRHTGQSGNVTISSRCNNIDIRRAVVLASGRKVSVPWAKTGKLLTVTTDLAMANAEMEIASGLKACPRRARNWTMFT